MSIHVVLASASPRRRELLQLIGVPHEVLPADVDESVHGDELPQRYVERLAREKAHTVARLRPHAAIIAADTTVVLGSEILGKPADAADASHMLAQLSARTHDVYTGIAVEHGGRIASAVERVAVTFRAIGVQDIADYVATGEPLDKAGAYGIQGFGATIVERVDGDYFSVMGLGLRRLVALLADVGIEYRPGGSLRTSERSPGVLKIIP